MTKTMITPKVSRNSSHGEAKSHPLGQAIKRSESSSSSEAEGQDGQDGQDGQGGKHRKKNDGKSPCSIGNFSITIENHHL